MLSLDRRVYVDLDGVLADLVGGALAAHGWPRQFRDRMTLYTLWHHLNISEEDFWAKLDNECFWWQLDATDDCAAVLSACEAFAPGNVSLLTRPRPYPSCLAGKYRWVRARLPHYLDRLHVSTAKHYLAGPGRLLIDDSDDEVRRWRDCGGDAILFPRPWNEARGRAGEAVAYLKECLRTREIATALVAEGG